MKLNKTVIDQLNYFALKYNTPDFIDKDPISIPHRFVKKQDIEISAFISATIAWGNRTSIISSANSIIEAMDNEPHQFITQHQDSDLKKMESLGHRTFLPIDLLYFISFLKFHYSKSASLESAFAFNQFKGVKDALIHFHNYFFDLPYAPNRTRKHVSTPIKQSACKRLNMFLRWMVRNDTNGVDFGLWKSISAAQLIIPLDVHVLNSLTELVGMNKPKPNWKTAEEVTSILRSIKPHDPVYYDYALFGYSVDKKMQKT